MITSKDVSAMAIARSHRSTGLFASVIARSTCDEAIHTSGGEMDCFAALAMTAVTPSS
jgi:hypothetical protein